MGVQDRSIFVEQREGNTIRAEAEWKLLCRPNPEGRPFRALTNQAAKARSLVFPSEFASECGLLSLAPRETLGKMTQTISAETPVFI